MQKPDQRPVKTGLAIDDILYVLFHHKWKIIGLSLAGFFAAAVVYLNQKPRYVSESRLLVRYVLQRSSGSDPYESRQSPGDRPGNSVINTEIAILTSSDLAIEVAEAVGPEILLSDSGGPVSVPAAAGEVLGNLWVVPGQSANVLHLFYGSRDPQMSRTILNQLVDCYFKKHLEIHRSASTFDEIAKQAAAAKKRHEETEAELNKLRSESGIMSLEDATGALGSQRVKTQEELLAARAQLAEKRAVLGELDQEPVVKPSGDSPAKLEEPPQQALTEYRSVTEVIGFLQKRDLELRIKFKPGNRLIGLNREQLNANEARRRALETQYPWLAAKAGDTSPANLNSNSHDALSREKASLAALEAKIHVLEAHLEEIGVQFGREYALGARIEAVQRKRDIEDAEYRALESNLKNARIDLTLDPSRMPNITIVQKPSEPVETFDPLTRKIILGLAGSGMAFGLGLAFLIELLFDRRVKRPIEIQTRLQLPLMLSIPYLGGRAHSRFMLNSPRDVPLIGGNDILELTAAPKQPRKAPLARSEDLMVPYAETLRDRIIFNFEMNNVVHKPKFVAVAGLSDGAGASTIAAGLARSFSEIKGAKVLLVDLSSPHPEQNPIHGDMPLLSLTGALEATGSEEFAQAPEKLYFASALARRNGTGLSSFTPLQLYELMPRLQASAYDYIIFDMPSVNETSRTLAMAGMMDKMLLVLDAENTSRDALKWGYSELVKGKADVSCVFNKTRTVAPTWLVGEN